MADWRRLDNTYPLYLQYIFHPTAATALSACIFLSFLFNPCRASPLVEDCFCLFYKTKRIPLLSLSEEISIYMYESPPYRRNWLWKNKTIAIHAKIKDVHLTSLLHKLLILVRAVAEYWRIPTKNDV